jgi:hypothetical protein
MKTIQLSQEPDVERQNSSRTTMLGIGDHTKTTCSFISVHNTKMRTMASDGQKSFEIYSLRAFQNAAERQIRPMGTPSTETHFLPNFAHAKF